MNDTDSITSADHNICIQVKFIDDYRYSSLFKVVLMMVEHDDQPKDTKLCLMIILFLLL